MSETLSDAGLVQQLRRRFGIRGDVDAQLETSILLVANLQDMDEPPFHQKIGGVFSLSGGPVAAQYSYIGLRSSALAQPGSRAVIRGINNLSAQTVYVKVVNSAALDAALGAAAGNQISGSWDSPDVDKPVIRPQLGTYQKDSAVFFGPPDFWVMRATETQIGLKFVVAPGNTLLFQGTTLNTVVGIACYWDEYQIG